MSDGFLPTSGDSESCRNVRRVSPTTSSGWPAAGGVSRHAVIVNPAGIGWEVEITHARTRRPLIFRRPFTVPDTAETEPLRRPRSTNGNGSGDARRAAHQLQELLRRLPEL